MEKDGPTRGVFLRTPPPRRALCPDESRAAPARRAAPDAPGATGKGIRVSHPSTSSSNSGRSSRRAHAAPPHLGSRRDKSSPEVGAPWRGPLAHPNHRRSRSRAHSKSTVSSNWPHRLDRARTSCPAPHSTVLRYHQQPTRVVVRRLVQSPIRAWLVTKTQHNGET